MGLFGNTAPYRDEIDGLADEFVALRQADNDRLGRFDQYRAELQSPREQSRTDRGTLNVGSADYGRPAPTGEGLKRHQFNLGFGQALTVKHAFRIAGRMPDAIVDRREESPEERYRSATMEKIWWGITRASGGEQQISSAAWDGSQLGAACFDVYFDIEKQMPLYRAIDPASVIVVKGVGDPHNFKRAFRFWKVPLPSLVNEYRGKAFRDRPIDVTTFQGDAKRDVMIVQMTDRSRTIRFALGTGDPKDQVHVPLYESVHDLGFVPYVVIPNLGPERDVWGWADYEFVREIAAYIPKLFGREADIIRSVSNGTMVSKGMKQTAAAIQSAMQAGGVIPANRDGSLEPVALPDVPTFEPQHADRAMQFLHMLGFAPDAAWGDGGAQSGSDRGLQLGPMLELTEMKQLNWSPGLGRIGEMCFRMIEKRQAGEARYTGTVTKGVKATPFTVHIGPDVEPLHQQLPDQQDGDEDGILLPRTPKELFSGDYSIRFDWPRRLDPDDPAYVASELNKFGVGAQSLNTTLENLGIESPEDEIKLIEAENEKHPWLRQGFIKLLEMQFAQNQQGQNDGSQNQASDPFGNAVAAMTGKDGKAHDAQAATAAGGGLGTLYGNG